MMNDGMLSQDEIDALLKVSEDDSEEISNEDTSQAYLSSIEIDALGEIGNISFGSSATTLSTLLNQKVEITTPSVEVIEKADIDNEVTFEPVSVQVNYIDGFSGKNVFVIKARDAAIIADIMLGGDGTTPDETLNDIHLSAVQETMNQMMGAAATSMSTVFDMKVDISPPEIINGIEDNANTVVFDEDVYVKVFFRLTVGNLIDSNMMQLIPLSFARQLVDQLLHAPTEEAAVVELEKTASELAQSIPNKENVSEDINPTYQEQPKEEWRRETNYLGNASVSSSPTVQEAAFSNFESPTLSKQEHRNLDMLLDVPLKVTVELGRTKQSISDILDLSAGSIIELDKLAGEPVDILVNEKLVAEGEVVVIEENFGVRVTDIISQTDRIKNLKK
ncbi:flagellar motor switch phosphatase FliY [Oceanobacillus iheyensis]|nr:flagellar motor switch phosphatase FliY [Oceanobacillus iheyensis]